MTIRDRDTGGEEPVRLFVCSHIGAAAQESYATQVTALVRRFPALLRRIPENSAHLTWAFLGEVPESAVSAVVDLIAAIARVHSPVRVHLTVPSVLFGGFDARLISAPVARGSDVVCRIAVEMHAALSQRSFVGSLPPFRSAHVTLARFRKGTKRRAARPIIEALEAGAIAPRDDVLAGVQVMSSILGPAGPRYSVIADLPFRVSE